VRYDACDDECLVSLTHDMLTLGMMLGAELFKPPKRSFY
jgi:hypothetical protein